MANARRSTESEPFDKRLPALWLILQISICAPGQRLGDGPSSVPSFVEISRHLRDELNFIMASRIRHGELKSTAIERLH